MKIQKEARRPERRPAPRKSRSHWADKASAAEEGALQPSFANEVVASDLASEEADRELALAAEEEVERDIEVGEPGNADEDVVRDFHRAAVHRAGRALSGRML